MCLSFSGSPGSIAQSCSTAQHLFPVVTVKPELLCCTALSLSFFHVCCRPLQLRRLPTSTQHRSLLQPSSITKLPPPQSACCKKRATAGAWLLQRAGPSSSSACRPGSMLISICCKRYAHSTYACGKQCTQVWQCSRSIAQILAAFSCLTLTSLGTA